MATMNPTLDKMQGMAEIIRDALLHPDTITPEHLGKRMYGVIRTAIYCNVCEVYYHDYNKQKLLDYVAGYLFAMKVDVPLRNELWFAYLFVSKFGKPFWTGYNLPIKAYKSLPSVQQVNNYINNQYEEFHEHPDNYETVGTRGEQTIRRYLEDNNISYIYNHDVGNPYDLSEKTQLRPDFALPDHNIFIEFNGPQHYRYCEQFHPTWHDFEQQQLRDIEMRKYCYDNHIKLIEITYDQEKSIRRILGKSIPKL